MSYRKCQQFLLGTVDYRGQDIQISCFSEDRLGRVWEKPLWLLWSGQTGELLQAYTELQ